MAKKKYLGCSLNLIIVLTIVFLALTVISFIGGSVGAMIRGDEPLSIFAVHAPQPELPAEHPFPGLPITNTMLTAWISILVLFGLFFAATRKMKLVPHGLQNLVEFFYDAAVDFIDDPAGKENGRKFFPVCVTIFLFVLANAWINLIPGFETIKMNGIPLLRNANTDINVPLMLAVVSFFFVEYWGFKTKGTPYLRKFFNFVPLGRGFKQLFTGKIKPGFGGIAMGLIAIFTGLLEGLSELVRMVSFTFRLFGNMTAGMILTLVMIYIIPLVVPSIFYGLEAFLGFVQAMIFGGLTLCFLIVAVMPEAEEETT
jgi:F-type H+-transporting ATPase subunit a